MGKGKTFTYLLIVCVAGVWGVIFYRIYMGINDDEPLMPIATATKVSYFKMVDHQHDKVSMDLNYRDPFSLSSSYDISERTSLVTMPVSASPTKPVAQRPKVNWAGIQYTGYVHNAASKQKMVIITINGNTATLAEGQSAQGLKLLKYYGDSIRVNYQGETKNIKIK